MTEKDDTAERVDPGAAETIRLMNHHRGLALGATLTIVGLGLVGTQPAAAGGQSDVGALLVLAGLLTLFHQIHRYGRLGQAGVSSGRKPRRAGR